MGYLLALGPPQKPAGSVKRQAKLLVFLALMFLWLINLYDKRLLFSTISSKYDFWRKRSGFILTWNLNQYDIFILNSRGCISSSKSICQFGVNHLIQNVGHQITRLHSLLHQCNSPAPPVVTLANTPGVLPWHCLRMKTTSPAKRDE